MPRGIYEKIKCEKDKKKNFNPLPQQKKVRDFFVTSQHKGLLLYHKLGSGKTCSAILIADKMLEEQKIEHVYILTPGSLRSGWITEYCEKCGENKKKLKNNFTFITYNYNVGERLPNFNNSLVIIDEIHNLINSVRNESFNSKKIYNKLLESNCKIIGLSGTPIYNYIDEIDIICKLLKPEEFEYGNCTQLFDTDSLGMMIPKNPTVVKRKFRDIISFFPGTNDEFVPTVIMMPPVKLKMTNMQEIEYWKAHYREIKIQKPNENLKFTDPVKYKKETQFYIMSKKRIMSRIASNFYYPPELKDSQDLICDDETKKNFENQKKRVDNIKKNEYIKIKYQHISFADEKIIFEPSHTHKNFQISENLKKKYKFQEKFIIEQNELETGSYKVFNVSSISKIIVSFFLQKFDSKPALNDTKKMRFKWFSESIDDFISNNIDMIEKTNNKIALPFLFASSDSKIFFEVLYFFSKISEKYKINFTFYKNYFEKDKVNQIFSINDFLLNENFDKVINVGLDMPWITKDFFKEGQLPKIYSPKLSAIIINIAKNINTKHIIFTYFKKKAGANLINSILNLYGVPSAIFSGDLNDSERKKLLQKYNSPKNIYGEKLKVLIVTEAGAEGIDLKDTRHIHIFESGPRISKIIQAIGRAARYKSHSRLPIEERNVKVWCYWSISNDNIKDIDIDINKKLNISDEEKQKIIDIKFYRDGEITIKKIQSLLKILENNSI